MKTTDSISPTHSSNTHNLYEYLKSYGDRKIVLSYSGNEDSFILFTALCYLKIKLSLEFEIVHFVHGNSSSDNLAQKIVQQQAEANFVKCTIVNRPITNELNGRMVRQKYFEENFKGSEYIILTAHHLDDSVETFLINLFTGASYAGLTGISDNNIINDVLYVRPFIFFNCYKKDLFLYKGCYVLPKNKLNIEFIKDDMNNNMALKRNAIRSFISNALVAFPFLKNKIISFTEYSNKQKSINFFAYQELNKFLAVSKNSYSFLALTTLIKNKEHVVENWFFYLFKNEFNVNLTSRHFLEFKRFIKDHGSVMHLPCNLSICNSLGVIKVVANT